ncbi:hypothetical protein ACOSP7_029067 [Xanthoceras sorbifolium]
MAYYGGDYYDQGRKRKEPASSGGNFYYKASPPKRFKEEAVHQNSHFECGLIFTGKGSCILKFDGCCKGNPGKGGAGAVLRSANGDFVLRLCEGVGDTKSNAAEYRAETMIFCKQIPGEWKVKSKKLAILCEEARELKEKFLSFEIEHIHRQPASSEGNFSHKVLSPKRFKQEAVGSNSSSSIVQRDPSYCILNFDGCSKGNTGKAGAGAVLRLREGVGRATNNVAEYRALILGLTYALRYRFTHIRVQGDSLLVCKQELNTAADAQANLGLHLRDGEVETRRVTISLC